MALPILSIFGYLVVSAVMLNVNKLALSSFDAPMALALIQATATCGFLFVLQILGYIRLSLQLAIRFICPGILWGLPLALNLQALKLLNPETLIIFRAATVFGVALGDHVWFAKEFRGHELLSLLLTILGALFYVSGDVNYDPIGYLWGLGYWTSMIANMLLLKAAFNTTKDVGNLEKTFYFNLTGCAVFAFLACAVESKKFPAAVQVLELTGAVEICISCALAILIGFFANITRDSLSPTAFDVLSNTSKFFTIAISRLIFRTRYTLSSVTGLFLALIGGALFSPDIYTSFHVTFHGNKETFLQRKVREPTKWLAYILLCSLTSFLVSQQFQGGLISQNNLPEPTAPTIKRDQRTTTISSSAFCVGGSYWESCDTCGMYRNPHRRSCALKNVCVDSKGGLIWIGDERTHEQSERDGRFYLAHEVMVQLRPNMETGACVMPSPPGFSNPENVHKISLLRARWRGLTDREDPVCGNYTHEVSLTALKSSDVSVTPNATFIDGVTVFMERYGGQHLGHTISNDLLAYFQLLSSFEFERLMPRRLITDNTQNSEALFTMLGLESLDDYHEMSTLGNEHKCFENLLVGAGSFGAEVDISGVNHVSPSVWRQFRNFVTNNVLKESDLRRDRCVITVVAKSKRNRHAWLNHREIVQDLQGMFPECEVRSIGDNGSYGSIKNQVITAQESTVYITPPGGVSQFVHFIPEPSVAIIGATCYPCDQDGVCCSGSRVCCRRMDAQVADSWPHVKDLYYYVENFTALRSDNPNNWGHWDYFVNTTELGSLVRTGLNFLHAHHGVKFRSAASL